MESKCPVSALARILVVDDERLIADTIALILQRHGFDATAVYSGRAALDCCDTVQPQLLLTDIMMPEMNGIETARRIQQKLPTCKLLFCTAHSTVDELVEQAGEGLELDIVLKPIAPRTLVARIERALGMNPPEERER